LRAPLSARPLRRQALGRRSSSFASPTDPSTAVSARITACLAPLATFGAYRAECQTYTQSVVLCGSLDRP
jgi:hypothetical protein